MKSLVEIIDLLNQILEARGTVRATLIEKFQSEIWSDESMEESTIDGIVNDLAYDLDYYEPNEEWRKQDASFYGDRRLEEMLKKEIIKLKAEGHE